MYLPVFTFLPMWPDFKNSTYTDKLLVNRVIDVSIYYDWSCQKVHTCHSFDVGSQFTMWTVSQMNVNIYSVFTRHLLSEFGFRVQVRIDSGDFVACAFLTSLSSSNTKWSAFGHKQSYGAPSVYNSDMDTCVSWSVSHRFTGMHLHSVMNWTVTSVWECCSATLSHCDRLIAQWRCGAAGMAPSEAKQALGAGLWGGWGRVCGPLFRVHLDSIWARLSWKSSCHFCCYECWFGLLKYQLLTEIL